jgi:hypothetical protein
MMKGQKIDGDVAIGRNVTAGGDMRLAGSATIGHSLNVKGWLDAPNVKTAMKGLYATEELLAQAYPKPQRGWYALVGRESPATLYVVRDGAWVAANPDEGDAEHEGEGRTAKVELSGEVYADLTDVTKSVEDIIEVVGLEEQEDGEAHSTVIDEIKAQLTEHGESIEKNATEVSKRVTYEELNVRLEDCADADKDLQKQIDAQVASCMDRTTDEAGVRAEADKKLQAAIEAEAAERKGAMTSLQEAMEEADDNTLAEAVAQAIGKVGVLEMGEIAPSLASITVVQEPVYVSSLNLFYMKETAESEPMLVGEYNAEDKPRANVLYRLGGDLYHVGDDSKLKKLGDTQEISEALTEAVEELNKGLIPEFDAIEHATASGMRVFRSGAFYEAALNFGDGGVAVATKPVTSSGSADGAEDVTVSEDDAEAETTQATEYDGDMIQVMTAGPTAPSIYLDLYEYSLLGEPYNYVDDDGEAVAYADRLYRNGTSLYVVVGGALVEVFDSSVLTTANEAKATAEKGVALAEAAQASADKAQETATANGVALAIVQQNMLTTADAAATYATQKALAEAVDAQTKDLKDVHGEINDALATETSERKAVDAEAMEALALKQDALTAGDGISIDGATIAVTEAAKRALFVDMWLTFGRTKSQINRMPEQPWYANLAVTGYRDGTFYALDTALTYEEAVETFLWSNRNFLAPVANRTKVRIIIVPPNSGSDAQDNVKVYMPGYTKARRAMFKGCSSLELIGRGMNGNINEPYMTVTLSDAANETEQMFQSCSSLRKVMVTFSCIYGSNGTTLSPFGGCTALEQFTFSIGAFSFSVTESPKLNYYTIKRLISGASGGNTITVHADVYAKLTGDTTNSAAAALTEDELSQWQALLTTATSKNITFATA